MYNNTKQHILNHDSHTQKCPNAEFFHNDAILLWNCIHGMNSGIYRKLLVNSVHVVIYIYSTLLTKSCLSNSFPSDIIGSFIVQKCGDTAPSYPIVGAHICDVTSPCHICNTSVPLALLKLLYVTSLFHPWI